jgi:hypothetical protein
VKTKKAWATDKAEGDELKAERLVRKAAGLIMGEIRETYYGREFYPTPDDIKSDGKTFLHPLLKLFLQCLVSSPLKQAALGQAVVQATRPQGCLMPLLFGVAVDLDQCGNQDVLIKLSRLGFALSVDEIQCFKHSVMLMPSNVDSTCTLSVDSAAERACQAVSECSERGKTVCEDCEDVQVDSSPGGTPVTAITHFIDDNVDHNI